MAGTGVGKFSSTAGSNTANMTVNFAENMAPSNVNNAARELMGHMRDMYEQLGDGYFEFGDGDGTYTVARGDADTITITSASDLSGVYFPGRKIRITDGGANVVEGTIASSSHSSTTQTVNLTGITLASGTPTKVELGIDTAAFGGKVILDDDGDTYIEAPTDDTIDFYAGGTKIGTFTATTVGFNDGVTITTADNSDTLSLISTDTDSAIGPNLNLYRNAGNGADADNLSTVAFAGNDDAGNATDFARITAQIDDASNGSEDVYFDFRTLVAGSETKRMSLVAAETVFNEDSIDLDFRVESNGNANMLFVDGGNDKVYIGRNTSDGVANVKLQVESLDSSSGISLHRASADTGGPALYLSSSRGASLGDDTVVQDGDDLGSIAWFGADGTDRNSPAASISGQVDGTPGGNDMPGRIVFKTTTDGGVTQTERMRIDNSGKVGIGETAPLCSNGGLHIKSGDSGQGTANVHADELVVEGSANSGINILSGASGYGSLYFGDSGDSNVGEITYNHSSDYMAFATSGSEQMRLNADGILSLNESAPDGTDGSLCLNQAGGDGAIITLKSSDIAHGMTVVNETDTYGDFRKANASEGGLQVRGTSESASPGFVIDGIVSTSDDNSSTGAEAPVHITGRKQNGTTTQVMGAANNIVAVRNSGDTKFIIKGDGEIFSDQSATVGTYDTYEDAQLVRSLELSRGSTMTGLINSQFDKYIKYNHETLAEANLVGREKDGTPNHFVNITGMQRLHNGAIWQQYEKHQRLAKAVYELAKVAVGEDKANEILEQNEIKLLN